MMQRATARNAPAKRPVRRAPADREALALRPGAPRIGLLGGSFNPAHDGHLHLSRLAIRHLGLHELWWLVTPQNPLKPVRGMAPLPARLAAARALARDPRIRVTDIEKRLGTRKPPAWVFFRTALHPSSSTALRQRRAERERRMRLGEGTTTQGRAT